MKAKKLKITAPAMKRQGLRAPKTTLCVYYFEHRVGVPWAEIRPLIASAFRHVQAEAFRDHGYEFIRRSQGWETELHLHKSKRGWWGRNVGARSRVFMGVLHPEPRKTTYPKFKDMPVFWHMDWKEHLVGLTAHELWHRWQPGHGKKAEEMCETVEEDAINTYRREQGYTFRPYVTYLDNENLGKCADCELPTNWRLEGEWGSLIATPESHTLVQETHLCQNCCDKRNLAVAKAARNGGSHAPA